MKKLNQILLSPDAAASADVDPLATPSGDNKLEYPLLKPDKIYRFNIVSAELVDAKSQEAPEGAKNLLVKVATTKDEASTTDDTINSGFILSKYIPTFESGKYTMKSVKDNLDLLNQAVFGKETKVTARQLIDKPDMLVGRPVDARVGINKDKTGQYNDSNTIRFVVPK